MTYKELHIGNIAHTKLRKAAKGGVLTLTKAELAGSSHTIHLHPESHSKVMKAKRAGKGCRVSITPHEIHHSVQHGGSVWSSIWHGIKSLWQPVIKPALSAAADVGIPALAGYAGAPQLGGVGRQALKSLTGIGVAHHEHYHHRGGKDGGKVAKGSHEARERMAKVRAAKKGHHGHHGHRGGSFML